jgi:large subunit ribosomal protein L25
MKSLEIKVSLRKETGKKHTLALRRQGLVPCVMYGGSEVIHFAAPENEFRHLLYTHNVYLVKLDIDGKQYQAVMQDAQFHPVTDKIYHLDFVQVFNDKPAVVSLPINITGSSIGLKAGGKLRQRRRYLKTKGFIKDMPETLPIDITDINIGDSIKVSQLKFDNLELLDPQQDMVVGVTTSRIAKGMEAGEELAPVAAAVEGEVEGAIEGAAEGAEATEGAEKAPEGASSEK